jgi:hypothetical protein
MTQQEILDILKVGQKWQSKINDQIFTIKSIQLDKWIGHRRSGSEAF